MSIRTFRRFTGSAFLGAAFLMVMGLPAVADTAPRALDHAYPNYQPPYPSSAQANGEQGDVTLNVRVNQDGHVRNIKLEKSSGFDDLDNAAIEGVLSWHYMPTARWSSWEHVTIAFRLPGGIIAPPKSTP
jgi:TonB family protein